jgi:hypothetical protein
MKNSYYSSYSSPHYPVKKQLLEPTVYQIEKDLQPYVNSFTDEAKKRGIDIKLENLIMKFDSSSANLCGKYSKQPLDGQRTIIIKKGFSLLESYSQSK